MSVSHWLLNKMILRELLIQLPQNRSAMPRPRPLPEKTCSPSNSQERSWLPDFPPGPISNHQVINQRSKFKPSIQSQIKLSIKFKTSIDGSKSRHNLGRHIKTNVPGGEAISSLGSQPRSGRNDDRLGRGNPKQDQQVIWGWLNELMECIKITNRHQDIFRLTVNDTDIWFKTREMQQTDLGKQMVQLQKDIKQMSKVWSYDEKLFLK